MKQLQLLKCKQTLRKNCRRSNVAYKDFAHSPSKAGGHNQSVKINIQTEINCFV
jgi:hypothetical protein